MSSVRPGGRASITAWSSASSASQPGRSRSAKRPTPRYHSSYSGARTSSDCFTRPRVRRVLPLESVPNFSEGRDAATIDAIGTALERHARLLDVHSDRDHNRSVYTLVGTENELAGALLAGVAVAVDRIDL